ncbi:AAA family ATPase [Candidatus Bipolaricaulota bacterium]|nr:AAA family ATPase [Candidatus Bipolaricaulota bacterium]
MSSFIIASTRRNAGKTSLLVGFSRATERRFGYVKPLGDRFLYRKKRLWDYDAALMVSLSGMPLEPERISIGFDHSKLRYMYDRKTITAEIKRLIAEMGEGRDGVLIECGEDLAYGASVYLDPLTLSKATGLPAVLVAGGTENEIADDLAFIKRFVGSDEANVAGVIVNKVLQPDEFRTDYLPEVAELGINILGVVPYERELTTMTGHFLAEKLFARVIAGESGLGHPVRNVVVGAMSVTAVMNEERFREPDKLVITSGDRSDMILAALEAGGTSCLVLTNNIVPPSNVVSKANSQGIPVLLVPGDTYATAMHVDRLVPLLAAEDESKVEILTRLVRENVDLQALEKL